MGYLWEICNRIYCGRLISIQPIIRCANAAFRSIPEAANDIDGIGKDEEKEKEKDQEKEQEKENGSGITDVITKYINEMNGRLESVEQKYDSVELKYGRMENNYEKLNKKILEVENSKNYYLMK